MSQISDTQPQKIIPPGKALRWIILSLIVLLLAFGALGGYWAGINDRLSAQATLLAPQVDQQFQFGVEALEAGQYELAIQHFMFVIEHNPGYPGVEEKYTQALLGLSISPSPSPVPSPTISPTPDLRGADAIFNSARERMAAQDWSGAIETLDSLRKTDPAYRTVDVDGMYYMALRNRGIIKLINTDCNQINLEGGMYDLSLAKRFGPLDAYAENLYSWSQMYLTGASFWEVDWSQAVYYFGQLYPLVPNFVDSSCLSASERYRQAAIKYGDSLVASGDFCGAEQYYNAAMMIPSNKNATAVPTATYARDQCISGGGGEVTPLPPGDGTATPEFTATPTGTPTETPTPTPITPAP